MKKFEGTLQAQGLRFGIVVARFNHLVTDPLLDGALAALRRHGAGEEDIEVVHVPGAFEAPLFARLLAKSGRIDAVIGLGAIIKGETPHYDYVARAAAEGIGRAALDTGVPISFGVITALTEEQAWARAGGAVGNRGEEAALATLQMAGWLHRIRTPRASVAIKDLRASRRAARRG